MNIDDLEYKIKRLEERLHGLEANLLKTASLISEEIEVVSGRLDLHLASGDDGDDS